VIERQIIPELLDSMSYFPVLGLVGPRQVGKTTLAKYVSDKVGKESVYIDLENPRDIAKLSDPNLFFELNEDKCVILDEIQRQPELFVILRSMVDRNRIPGRFLILGSASPELIRDSSES
jgi:predicted AAA+ superfamily ATPase